MNTRIAALCALTVAACAPGVRTAVPAPYSAAAATGMDSARRWNLRPLPVSEAYRRGLAAGTRTPQGEPGPRYWQQSVAYRIRADLDPQSALLHGSERIVYRNRSPDTLRTVVLNLYQNIYTENAARNRRAPNTGGVTLERVVAQGTPLAERPPAGTSVVRGGETPPAQYEVQGTIGRLFLPHPLAPGDSAVLEID